MPSIRPASRSCAVRLKSCPEGSGSPEGWLCASTMAVARAVMAAANTSRGSTMQALMVPSATRASSSSTLRALKHSTWKTSRCRAGRCGVRYVKISLGVRRRGLRSATRWARRPSSSAANTCAVRTCPIPGRAHKALGSCCTRALSPPAGASSASASARMRALAPHNSPRSSGSVRASAPNRTSRSRASPPSDSVALTDPSPAESSPPTALPTLPRPIPPSLRLRRVSNTHAAFARLVGPGASPSHLRGSGSLPGRGGRRETLHVEVSAAAMELNQLLDITEVTEVLTRATQGKEGGAFRDAQRAEIARLEKDCARSPELRCDVVTLYQGGKYQLYRYKRFQDVRLVFAPEESIAFFGGDPDNFEFPRYNYDVSFLRVYENDKPAKQEHWLRWSAQGARPDELTFVSGHPGRTSRLLTVAQLLFHRDYMLPETLIFFARLRGTLDEFQRRGPEYARISGNTRMNVENAYKAMVGRREALVSRDFFASKVAEEQKLRDWVKAQPERAQRYGPAWDAIAQATDTLRDMRVPLRLLEQRAGYASELFDSARMLTRAAEERGKPNERRLEEFSDASTPELEQRLFSPAPVYPKLEETLLAQYLSALRAQLGADDPVVKKVLGTRSPQALARQVVAGTRLGTAPRPEGCWRNWGRRRPRRTRFERPGGGPGCWPGRRQCIIGP